MAAVDAALAERLVGELTDDLKANGRLGLPRRYLRGEHDLPYMPKGAKREFEHLARRSITNWLPLLSDTYAQGLFVDGYRPARVADNAPAWAYWQENGLDARQSIAHRGAIEYGTSYAVILPGTVQTKRIPYWRPLSPLRSAAWYEDDDDDFPALAIRQRGRLADDTVLWEVYDSENVYTFAQTDDKFILSRTDAHGLGVTPFIRFRDRLDGESRGIIAASKVLQDRINEIVFSTIIAIQYAAFRQRWATGMAIPVDDEPTLPDGSDNPNFGKPVASFEASVKRLWITDNPEAKFGDFAQTEISGHLSAYTDAVRTLAATNQVSPTIFTGDLINVSDTALAALEKGQQRRIGDLETIFGEAWENGFRLAALAAGDRAGATDTASQVRWRDTEARSLAVVVDALVKQVQGLQIPVEAAWEQIPGVTDQDLAYWRELRASQQSSLDSIVQEFQRQSGVEVSTR